MGTGFDFDESEGGLSSHESHADEVGTGAKVLYVPDLGHAFQRDPQGNYPWVMGKKKTKNFKGVVTEEIEELSDEQLKQALDALKRSPNPTEARKMLVPIRPKVTWAAVITAEADDGTFSLDIQSPQGGVTLHESKVVHDPKGLTPRSFHLLEEK